MKKLTKLAIILAIAVSVLVLAAVSVNAEEAVLISNATELAEIEMDGNYKLSANIDLSGVQFVPIGDETAPFTGTFDGAGYKIIGLEFTEAAQSVGLFGYISNATVKNLTVENASVVIDHAGIPNPGNTSEPIHTMNVGIICGYADGSALFENCSVSGAINVKYGGTANIAGICGKSTLNGETPVFDMCQNTADITVDSSDYASSSARASGIVAEGTFTSITYAENKGDISVKAKLGATVAGISAAYGYREVSKCANIGELTAVSVNADADVGGLIATSMYGTVNDCYNMGNISASAGATPIAGGICAASRYFNKFDRCYNIGTVTVNKGTKFGALIGTTAGSDTLGNNYVLDTLEAESIGVNNVSGGKSVTELTDAQLQIEASFENFDFDMVWYINTEGEYKYPKLRKLKFADSAVKGDADGDDKITPADEVALARYLAGFAGLERIGDIASTDLNNDRKVSSIDLVALTRHLANWLGYETLPLN